jgi:hypothetical protein
MRRWRARCLQGSLQPARKKRVRGERIGVDAGPSDRRLGACASGASSSGQCCCGGARVCWRVPSLPRPQSRRSSGLPVTQKVSWWRSRRHSRLAVTTIKPTGSRMSGSITVTSAASVGFALPIGDREIPRLQVRTHVRAMFPVVAITLSSPGASRSRMPVTVRALWSGPVRSIRWSQQLVTGPRSACAGPYAARPGTGRVNARAAWSCTRSAAIRATARSLSLVPRRSSGSSGHILVGLGVVRGRAPNPNQTQKRL